MNEAVFKTILHRIKGATDSQKQSREPESKPAETPATQVLVGVTATDVIRVFEGARVIAENKPISCRYCDKQNIPDWRRGGEIVQRIWPNRRSDWGCHFCGRAAAVNSNQRHHRQ